MSLPPGWYPRNKGGIAEFLDPLVEGSGASSGEETTPSSGAFAAIAPHAGWYYSGACAARALTSLNSGVKTVAVIGGHLPRGMSVLMAAEDGVRTPLGTMPIDTDLREAFGKQMAAREDRYADNTVEVLLPMVHYLFPGAELLWLRFPAEIASFEAGKLLAETAAALERPLAVLASTDLTHYGANYGFSPKGAGKPSLEWVKKVNDAAFIGAVLEGDPSSVLERAEEDSSACSAGAVLGALGFAAAHGLAKRELLRYATSADMAPNGEIPDSFVGYAAIGFR